MTNRGKNEEKILTPEFLDELKRVREERGISVEEVAVKTNIKPQHIRAIEEGNLEELPGGVYNRAFIRSICEFLGIDTTPYEKSVDSGTEEEQKKIKIELGRPDNATIPSKLIIIGVLFLVFILYSVFYGPRTTKEEAISNTVNINKADSKYAKMEEQRIINDIDQVSPIQKEANDLVERDVIVIIRATEETIVQIKDSEGKDLANKKLIPTETMMFNTSSKYFLKTDKVENLEIYLDGIQITNISEVEVKDNIFILTTDELIEKIIKRPIESSVQPISQQIKKESLSISEFGIEPQKNIKKEGSEKLNNAN